MDDIRAFNTNNFNTDYKAAVLAAEMVEAGVDIHQLFIWPVGGGQRNFSKDILSIDWYAPLTGYKDFICIKSSREGLYDMLPEGLFHPPVPYASTRSPEEVIDQIRLHKQQEKEARQFFLPLEAELNLFRILIELQENKIDKKNIYNDLVEIFRPGWDIFALLDAQQANVFLHMIPFLHHAKGNLERLQNLAGLLLQVPIRIALRPAGAAAFDGGGCGLGESVLGVDMVSGAVFNEGDDAVEITIGPLPVAQALTFYNGTRADKILRMLVGYFVPADVDVSVKVEILPGERAMVLGEQEATAVLGFSSFLG
ncbi:MAG TPA: type VI secretion system baseplate subunit TssG [Chitinophaga sp.]